MGKVAYVKPGRQHAQLLSVMFLCENQEEDISLISEGLGSVAF